ncbi:Dixin-A [Bulinus truncatus]|nr:Dixin-A [Bulinus truncatus]
MFWPEDYLKTISEKFCPASGGQGKIYLDLKRELLKREHTVNMINEQNYVDKHSGDQIITDRTSESGKVNSSVSRPFTSPRVKKMSVSKEPFRVSQQTPQHRMTTSSSPARSSPVKRGGVTQQVLARNIMTRPNVAVNVISKGSPCKTGKSQIPVLNELTVSGGRSKSSSPSSAEAQWTNVIYYTANSDRPLTCLIRKKLGEIRLRDLKSVIPDSNLYHYFFKALDPEYGSIKEELSNDDDLLPGWEGKIVAWLEEEPGTAC